MKILKIRNLYVNKETGILKDKKFQKNILKLNIFQMAL